MPTIDETPRRDDLLMALERAGVEAARLEQVADLIAVASVLDDRASVGSIVTVADRAGRTAEYELVARPTPDGAREQVEIGSRTGRALLGARPGEYVRVTLDNGRQRRVRVIGVTPA